MGSSPVLSSFLIERMVMQEERENKIESIKKAIDELMAQDSEINLHVDLSLEAIDEIKEHCQYWKGVLTN